MFGLFKNKNRQQEVQNGDVVTGHQQAMSEPFARMAAIIEARNSAHRDHLAQQIQQQRLAQQTTTSSETAEARKARLAAERAQAADAAGHAMAIMRARSSHLETKGETFSK